MDKTILVQGRELSPADIQGISDLIAARPKGTRWKLSRELCERWGWRTLTGQLKDMSCRILLNKLDGRGLITLPPKGRRPMKGPQVIVEVSRDPICAHLSELTPLKVTLVAVKSPDARLLHQLLSSYHYLGFRANVGETIGRI
jgi:hypothetical protein